MATNETVFFIRGSYILLVDLESWYDNGFVTPEDEVRMFDGKKKQVCTIKDLIKDYGCRFPFRRGNDSLVVNDFGYEIKNENNPPDLTKYSKGQLLGQRSMNPKLDLNLSEGILTELGPMDLIDYPLLNVDNEPEEDRITGDAILKEFHKLRQTWVLRNWNSDYAKYFKFLERGHKGNGSKMTQPICRICGDEKPRHLMKHSFGSFHTWYMKYYSVSLRSFEFWSRKLQECLEKCGKIPGVDIRSYEQVEQNLKNQNEQKKEKMHQDNEIVLPSYSRSQVLAERSLNQKFELNLSEDILKVLGRTHLIDYPLLNVDNEPEEDRITGDTIHVKFGNLKNHWVLQNWNSKYAEYFEYLDKEYKGNSLKMTQPICRICKTEPTCLMEHLFSYSHLRKMITHSFSLRSFEFWSQKLHECFEHCGEISGASLYKPRARASERERRKRNVKLLEDWRLLFDSYF